MDRPRISVVVDCRESAAGCHATIAGVLGQAQAEVEVVTLVAGCLDSPGPTAATDFCPGVRVIPAAGLDSAAARNLAAGFVRGDFICSVGAGDTVSPDYLETALALLDRDHSVAFVVAGRAIARDDTRVEVPQAVDLNDLLWKLHAVPGRSFARARCSPLADMLKTYRSRVLRTGTSGSRWPKVDLVERRSQECLGRRTPTRHRCREAGPPGKRD